MRLSIILSSKLSMMSRVTSYLVKLHDKTPRSTFDNKVLPQTKAFLLRVVLSKGDFRTEMVAQRRQLNQTAPRFLLLRSADPFIFNTHQTFLRNLYAFGAIYLVVFWPLEKYA